MHQNSLDIMRQFLETHSSDGKLKILDLGSRIASGQEKLGSYRQFCLKPGWQYTGADVVAGNNVDIVFSNGYIFPFKDEEFDIIISGQTIEHIEYPWVWFCEMTRVLKCGGSCCIIAPAVIHEHRYPIDTYRYYPDGMIALAKWSGLKVIKAKKVVFGKEEDTFLIAKKV